MTAITRRRFMVGAGGGMAALTFSRFALPDLANGDAIEATYDAGVLTVRVPKKPEAKPRQISVKVA